ncbi:MAG: inverse autotransporter beta domain-containing protein [Legionellales bacterium]|nr:inverse autotransporter beta domain-containing protein [Legionellales bacterium]
MDSRLHLTRGVIIYAILLSLFLVGFQVESNSYSKYSPYIQAESKLGNRRQIFRPGMVIPLYQHPRHLIYIPIIGMTDSTNALEGNIGFGIRNLLGNNILGVYGFYDIRKSSNKNIIHQVTIGIEWFRSYLEFRGNIYLPKQKAFPTSEPANISHYKKLGNTLELQVGIARKIEQALRGFDIDIGCQIPKMEDLTIRGGYYHFGKNRKYLETRKGLRSNLDYQLNKVFQLNLEISHDNQRKWVYFGGITASYTFEKPIESSSLTRLERKMTSLPIRDIDAVVGYTMDENITSTAEILTIDEGTSVIIADSIENKLVLLDLTKEGNLLEYTSTFEFEDEHISNRIKQLRKDNILTDENVIVLYINRSHQFSNVNKFNSKNTINITNKQSSIFNLDKETKECINLLNLVSKSVENIDIELNISESKNKNLKQKLVEKQSQIQQLESQASIKQQYFQTEINNKQNSLEKLKRELDEKKINLQLMQHKDQQLENQAGIEQRRLDRIINERQQEIVELQRNLNTGQEQLRQQRLQMQNFQNKTNIEQQHLQAVINEKEKDIKKLQKSQYEEQKQHKLQRTMIQNLKNEARVEKERSQKDINEKQLKISKLQMNITMMKEQIEQKDVQIQILENQISLAQQRVENTVNFAHIPIDDENNHSNRVSNIDQIDMDWEKI